MKRSALIFGILTTFIVLNLESNDAVTFKLTNFVCESYNKSWVVINYCRLKVIKRGTIAAYANASVFYPAYQISVNLQLFKRANGYKPWLLNTRIDGCRFIRNPYNPAVRLISTFILDFTNFNHSCPYVGTQIVDGLYLRPELLTLPLPTGDYKLDFNWYFNNRLQFGTNASFSFVENLIDQ